MLHLTPLLVAGWALALFGALTRLAPFTKPFWDLLGKKVSAVLPSIVAGLPTAFAAFQNVKTWLDVTQATLVTTAVLGAFALPGASSPHNHPDQMAAYIQKKADKKDGGPPSIPPLLPVLPIFFVIALFASMCCLFVLSSCGLKGPIWPATVSCLEPLAADAVKDVENVLLSGGNVEDELKPLAEQYGPGTVLCIVNSLIDQWDSAGNQADPRTMQANIRAKAFLQKTGSKVSR